VISCGRVVLSAAVGLCYQLGGDNKSVLSAAISLPADNTDNSGPKEVLRGGSSRSVLQCFGFGVAGFGFRVSGLGGGVSGLEFGVLSLGLGVYGRQIIHDF